MEEPPRAWGRGLVEQCLVRLGQRCRPGQGRSSEEIPRGCSQIWGLSGAAGLHAGWCALMGRCEPVLLCTPEAPPDPELLPRACCCPWPLLPMSWPSHSGLEGSILPRLCGLQWGPALQVCRAGQHWCVHWLAFQPCPLLWHSWVSSEAVSAHRSHKRGATMAL